MRRSESSLLLFAICALTSCTSRSIAARPAEQAEIRQEAQAAAVPLQAADRMLVRRAQLGVESEDIAGTANRASTIATAAGGYIASSTQSKERWSLELRVPSQQLDATLDSVSKLGKVTNRSVSATDVTERAVDLDARVAALRASRDRLQQLLSRAGSVTELAAVEAQLARTQGELDALEGQLKSLRGQVSLSALNVDITKPIVLGPLGYVLKGLVSIVGKLFVWR